MRMGMGMGLANNSVRNMAPSIPVATPSIVVNGISLTITSDTVGAAIYYTTNGSAPTAESTLYSGAITLEYGTSYTIKAIGILVGYTNSAVASSEFLTIPAAPTASAATGVTDTGFTANWSNVSGESGYILQISTGTGAGFSAGIVQTLTPAQDATSQAVSSLTAGTTYYYRVRGTNAGGDGANSNEISLETLQAETQAAISKMVLDSVAPFSGDTLAQINKTIKEIKTASLWSKLDGLYFFANPTTPANNVCTLYNFVNPTHASIGKCQIVNSPTFDTTNGKGWIGSTGGYLDTGIKQSVSGMKHTRYSCSAGAWINTDPTASSTGLIVGLYSSGCVCSINPKRDAGSLRYVRFSANDNTANLSDAAISQPATGLFSYSRTDTEDATVKLRCFRNGTKVNATDKTTATTGWPDVSVKFGGTSQSGWNSDGRICFGWVGGGLSIAEESSLYACINDNFITQLQIGS